MAYRMFYKSVAGIIAGVSMPARIMPVAEEAHPL